MAIASQRRDHSIGKNPPLPQAGHCLVEAVDLGHAATKDDHVRIKQVDHRCQRPRQAMLVAIDGGESVGIARCRQGDDLRRSRMVSAGGGEIAGKAGTGQEGFDAAAAPQ